MMVIKNNKNLLIVIVAVAIFSTLSLTASFLNVDKRTITTQINPIWSIDLTSIEAIDNSDAAYDQNPVIDNNKIVINPYVEDSKSLTYLVKVKNNGTYDAILDNIKIDSKDLDIDIININEKDIINKNSIKSFKIVVTNNKNITNNEMITIELEFNKK